MKWEEFSFLLFNRDFKLLISLFIVIFLILLLTFRKNINNLFDPLNIMVINLSSCFSVLIYLFFKNLIISRYFYQLIITNILFLITLKKILSYKAINVFEQKLNKKFFEVYYLIHTIFFFLAVIFFYKFVNNRLLTDTLNAFNNLGLLKYTSTFLFPGQLILIFIKRDMYDLKSKVDYFICILVFILFLFSGGKTATITYFLYIFSVFYFFNLFQENKMYEKLKRFSFLIIILGLVGVIALFSVRYKESNLIEILKKIIHRVFSSGDTYYMAYVNNNIEKIEGISLIRYYILPLLDPILRRVIKMKEFIYPGFQIMEVVYGYKTNFTGPNTRYDLVWQMNLGYFGIIGGIFSGILMGSIRKVKTLNFIFLEVLVILFVNMETIIIDFGLFGKFLFSCIFMLFILLFISYFIFKIIKCRKRVTL